MTEKTTEKQMRTYRTKCEIEYSQEYLPARDMTIIFEELFVVAGPDKICVRERICGFYHGDPTEEDMRHYMTTGCEAVMEDDFMASLTKEDFDMGQWLKDNGVTSEYAPKTSIPRDYAVVVYGGFDNVPLIKYQREYETKEQALGVYHELEDTFRLEHKIYDNELEEVIEQEDCSSMAVIESGPHDEETVISFRSLLYYENDKTNAAYFSEDYRQIINYLTENCNL